MSVGGGKRSSSSRSRVQIPDFLRPFVTQATGVASGALRNLQRDVGRGDLVADFTPAQELAQLLGIDRALGGGDFFPVAQDTILSTARGEGLDSFLPQASFDALTGAASGSSLDDFVSPEALSVLRGGTQGDPVLEGLLGRSPDTSAIRGLLGDDEVAGQDILSQLTSRGTIPDASRAALERTASGDFLYGGEGFDAAVEAAVRAATPGVLSAFGSAGPSRARGGLAETAIAQSGIDAFASQFARERGNQLSAAGALADLERADTGQRADIASRLAGVDLNRRGQDLSGAGLLAELGLADTGQDADIATLLNNLRTGSAGALAGLSGDERSRSLSSAGLLADIGLAERGNQLDAARDLPGIAEADIGLLERIGATQQDLEQLRRMAPMDAQMQLLTAALTGLPISSFLGSNTRGRSRAFSFTGDV